MNSKNLTFLTDSILGIMYVVCRQRWGPFFRILFLESVSDLGALRHKAIPHITIKWPRLRPQKVEEAAEIAATSPEVNPQHHKR